MNTPTSPLLVCLDLDGTTIDYHSRLSPNVARAIRAVVAAGHHVVIATGRTLMSAVPIARELGLSHGHLVCSNGAVRARLDASRDGGYELVEAVTFDPGPALDLLWGHLPEAHVAAEEVGIGHRVSNGFPREELMGELTEVSRQDLVSRPVTRLTFRDPSSSEEDFLTVVQRLGLHGVNYAVGFTAWLDLTPEGVSKASALEAVRLDMGIDARATVAVGDHRNDLEMLMWAQRGIAMGQAPPEVVEVADEVTGTVDEDGLAQVLRTLPGVAV